MPPKPPIDKLFFLGQRTCSDEWYDDWEDKWYHNSWDCTQTCYDHNKRTARYWYEYECGHPVVKAGIETKVIDDRHQTHSYYPNIDTLRDA